jgi:hypothetical protein
MWLVGRLVPDHKTIADFRKDNGAAVRKVCSQFVALCREIGLLSSASVAIDGSKFKVRIPMKTATDSDAKRPPVPIQTGHVGRVWNRAS